MILYSFRLDVVRSKCAYFIFVGNIERNSFLDAAQIYIYIYIYL